VDLIVAWIAGGWRGAFGMALGISVSALGLVLWWRIIRLVAAGAESSSTKASFGGCVTVLAFLLKLPIFFCAAFFAVKIGGISRLCFLIGLGQVYLALIGWSLKHNVDQPS
jgi:hypothetical protein